MIIPHGTTPANTAQAKFLNLLQWRTAATKETQRGHWVGIHSDELRTVVGHAYRRAVDALLENGTIEVNERFAVDRFSKSYRLAWKFRNGRTTTYTGRKVSQKAKSRIRLEQDDHVGQRLVEQFSRFTLPSNVRCKGWDHFNAQSIREGRYYAVRCPYGRFHSTFTGLPRKVKRHLSAGEPTHEVDLKNCQPLILGMAATRNQHASTEPKHTTHTNTTTTPEATQHHKSHSFDFQKYIDLCSSGKLYEHLAGVCIAQKMTLFEFIPADKRHRHGQNRQLTRDDVKKAFIVIMFADIELTKRIALFTTVEEEFPSIARFIIDAKRQDYRHLAHQCQRLESQLMVGPGGVAERFMDAAPIAPIFSVHDSIATTQQYTELAQNCIIERFRIAGATPSIDVS